MRLRPCTLRVATFGEIVRPAAVCSARLPGRSSATWCAWLTSLFGHVGFRMPFSPISRPKVFCEMYEGHLATSAMVLMLAPASRPGLNPTRPPARTSPRAPSEASPPKTPPSPAMPPSPMAPHAPRRFLQERRQFGIDGVIPRSAGHPLQFTNVNSKEGGGVLRRLVAKNQAFGNLHPMAEYSAAAAE